MIKIEIKPISPKIIGIVGSRDLNHNELRIVENIVSELMKEGHYILSDGSRTVGLRVMERAYEIDPKRIYVYLHCSIKRNPIVTHNILKKIDSSQVLTIPGPYNDRNIFYRNKLLVQKCDLIIAFWKNKSTDVQHIIQCCQKNKPQVPVVINEY